MFVKHSVIQKSSYALNISLMYLDFNHINGKNPNVGKY